MMRFTKGNLLEAEVEALVNTVNTVGVMGKGIALMFKETYPQNYREYREACKRGDVKTGSIFVKELPPSITGGPRWILNFPTKQDWRTKTKIEWVKDGLQDLRRIIKEKGIRSVAMPPLGCGNGGLAWKSVRPLIEGALRDLDDVDVVVYEPTRQYQNIAKRKGVQTLTPARALVAELVRRYKVLGIECSLLEIQKLVYFLDRMIRASGQDDPFKLSFRANRYGPYSDKLRHLLDALDGSYLHCRKRLGDANPWDAIWFDSKNKDRVEAFLKSEGKTYLPALEKTTELVDGFESPLGMELLATVDWLLEKTNCEAKLDAVREALGSWPDNAGQRKNHLFDDRMLGIALDRLTTTA